MPPAAPDSLSLPGASRPQRRFRSAVWRGALVGVLCALACWCLQLSSLFRLLDHREFDACFAWRGTRPTHANVVIVDLDDATLQQVNKPLIFCSPELATVVRYLHDQGAAAIGVDFLWPDNEQTMEWLLPRGPGSLEAMGVAVGEAGNVVLPEWLDMGEQPAFEWRAPSSRPWADLGFVDQRPDMDACLRRQELRRWSGQHVHASWALALLIKAQHLSDAWLAAPTLVLDGEPIPLDADGCLRTNYVGPAGTMRAVPFHEVLAAAQAAAGGSGPADAAAGSRPFQDSLVLIGARSAQFKDVFFTPYTNETLVHLLRPTTAQPGDLQMSGVEIHANVLATLLDRAWITTPWFLATPLTLLVAGAALGAVLARCSLELGALVTILHHLAWRGLALAAFCWADWRVETAAMYTLGVALYGTIFALRWRWIRRMMGMVKSEAIARSLEAGGTSLDLGGQQRDITVLFCDIRNFTTFSERHSAHEVVRLLNAFFAVAVPAIEAEGGTVNAYLGDAVMVLFGAPGEQPDHAARAVRAAAAVVRRVHALTDRWTALGAEHFRIGVGIHTGKAVVGTVGSPRRLDYTAIGDTVNTAARLESANKQLHTEVLISQATFDALPADEQQRIAALGEPHTLSVTGKQQTLLVYRAV